MTLINNKYKFIFIHVPKNAGSAITKHLTEHSTPIDIEIGVTKIGEILQPEYIKRYGIAKHSTAQRLANALPDIWPHYFKFAVIRNPYERFISAYFFLRKWDFGNPDFTKQMNDFKSINDFIGSNFIDLHSIPDQLFNPQSSWLYSIKEELIVDFLIRNEELSTGLDFVAKKVGLHIENSNIKKINVTVKTENEFKESLDKNSIEWINDFYRSDFINFGYDFYKQ